MDCVIILCAGSGSRAGFDYNKIFYPLGKATVLDTAIACFEGFGRIVLAASPADLGAIRGLYPNLTVVEGGATRSDSVRNALVAAKGSEVVAIHDAARPFVTPEVIRRAMDSARRTGSGIPAVKSIDHVCLGGEDNFGDDHDVKILEYLQKSRLYNIQTPQCFRYAEIADAYDRVRGSFADDSEVYMRAGHSPTLTEGDYKNKKLTTPADFAGLSQYQAVGSGFDVHRLVEGRRLVLGGVEIPYEKGLLGHSDADVLAHALCDAILSAAGEPDIGVLFPDNDPEYLGADSMALLSRAHDLLIAAGRRLSFVSCVIIAQKPKLAALLPLIRGSLAKRLGLSEERINISATTTEFLGIVGEGCAIAASAAVLCE